ncbi:MAG: HesA/MoeB/ThiF family protein [Planctomycetes bacterium]|nr:HesA/MoeB/ThiF family protein [Planctomycetota bacterium]
MMISEDKRKILADIFSGRGISELSLEDTLSIAEETKASVKAVEWFALDSKIEPLRYKRNLGTVGFDGQKKLLESSAIIVGMGGLGGYLVEELGRVGVGEIVCCDYDVFDATNLNRQILSEEGNLGVGKVDIARQRLEAINSGVEFVGVTGKFNDIDKNIWQGAGVVFDCLDNIDDRMVLAEKCTLASVKLVHGAIGGWYGQVGVIRPGSDVLSRIYKGQRSGIEKDVGTPPFTAATAASIMASKGVKVLTGIDSEEDYHILFFDLLENDWRTLKFSQ